MAGGCVRCNLCPTEKGKFTLSSEEYTRDSNDSGLTLKELQASELKYRSLIEANGVGYVILSSDGTVLEANQHYVVFTGHKELSEILGRNVCDWVSSKEKDACAQAFERCLREGLIRNFETKYLDSEGGVTALMVNATVERSGGTVRILALCRDITAQKREEELWIREKQFTDAVFESAPFLLYEYDDQLRLIRWNKRAEAISGYSAEELHLKPLFGWFSEDMIPLITVALNQVFEVGYTNVEADLVMKNGTKVPYHFTAVRLSIDGKQFFTGIGVDLTARKLAEQAVRESEARFRTLIESAPVPIGIGRSGTMLYANSSYLRMLGAVTVDQLVGRPILEQFAPECRDQIRGYIMSRERGMAAPSEYETVGLKLDGAQFPVHVAVTHVQLADGPVSLAFATDITARKEAEETIRAERDRAENYLQIAEVVLLALDCEANITLINRKGSQIVGYEEAELLGRNWFRLCLPPEDQERVQNVFLKMVAGAVDPFEYFENPVVTKDGRRRLIAWHNSLMKDDAGHIIGTLSSGEDITDRRQAEDDLARVNEQLQVERETLRQKNIALQEVLAQISASKQSISTHIHSNIEKIVLPILDRLPAKLDPQGKQFLSLARDSLTDIVSPFINGLESQSRKLTQRELELCELIRRGVGSKEIAELRGSSVQTVIKQRKIIRRKLGISGKEVNLASYLSEILSSPESPRRDES
jgi:PAS domain S-box-containing protein